MTKKCRLKHFPVSFFSIILGMAGLTIAYEKIEEIFKISINFSSYFLMLTLLLFILLSILYLIKIIWFRDEVIKEFNSPVKLNFFPAFSVSIILLSINFLSSNIIISKYLWIIGTIIHLIFTIKIISIWIHYTKFDIKHMNPAWFIPAVGNILIPIAGIAHSFVEISWFFYSVGFILWLTLFIIFFNRIIFHKPLAEKLLPTLFILIAPPAVGFISIVKLTGSIDGFAKILYYFGLFLFLVLSTQFKFFRNIKFYLSWWAYSFPIAAITIASTLMFHFNHLEMFKYISVVLFLTLNILIFVLSLKTISIILKKGVCIEDEDE